MTERLADITAHIAGVRQLGSVVNAMRGIAAARAQQARGQLTAVESYAAIISSAMGRALALAGPIPAEAAQSTQPPALVLFCAEQGFAGAFSERVLEAAARYEGAKLFLLGARGLVVAAERGVKPLWHAAMPSHSQGMPKLCDTIAQALYRHLAVGGSEAVEVLFTERQASEGFQIVHRRLLPFDPAAFQHTADRMPPLVNLTPEALLAGLSAEYLHGQLCNAALHAFAAENQARMESMAAAHSQIDRQLTTLQANQRLMRQEEITAEIIELAAGEVANREREAPSSVI